MTNGDYNKLLDIFAQEAMKSILTHEQAWLNNTSAFIASCAYDYA